MAKKKLNSLQHWKRMLPLLFTEVYLHFQILRERFIRMQFQFPEIRVSEYDNTNISHSPLR